MLTAQDKDKLRIKLIQSAIDLVPILRERAYATKKNGKLPEETIQAMKDAGFFRIMQPERFGGYELNPQDFFDVQIKLAEGCMSTAWVLGVVAIHNWQLGMYENQAQIDVWGDDDTTLISSSYMPVGKVSHVDGGFMLSGRWGFSSGSKHCQWAFLGALVPNPQGGAPDYCTFLVPRRDYEIIDNWDVCGLEGTGSHDILIQEPVFVPSHRLHRSADGFSGNNPGCKENTNPIFTLPFGQVFVRAVCSSSIGALQGALDSFLHANKVREDNNGQLLPIDPTIQLVAAEAMTTIDECKTVLYRNFDLMLTAAIDKTPLDIQERIKWRYEASIVAKKCTESVNALFANCGASGVFIDQPICRAWADINTGRGHVANYSNKFGQNLGGTTMGLPNQDFFL